MWSDLLCSFFWFFLTSSWIEALRSNGRKEIRERVLKFMNQGTAALCDMVLVELWNGAGGEYEKKRLKDLEDAMICLETTSGVWKTARQLAQKCRQAGQTMPSADLIIAACALTHGSEIEHCDSHIDFILKADKEEVLQ